MVINIKYIGISLQYYGCQSLHENYLALIPQRITQCYTNSRDFQSVFQSWQTETLIYKGYIVQDGYFEHCDGIIYIRHTNSFFIGVMQKHFHYSLWKEIICKFIVLIHGKQKLFINNMHIIRITCIFYISQFFYFSFGFHSLTC